MQMLTTTQKRLKILREKLSENKIEALLVSQPENRRYLSGFTGSTGYLLITHSTQILATDFRYVEQVKRQSPEYRLFQLSGELSVWLPEMISNLHLKELSFEDESITFNQFQHFNAVLAQIGIKLMPANGLIEFIRMFKEPAEIELIKKAIDLSDAAIKHARTILHTGMTEIELAWEIEKYMREHGSQSLPFEVIAAAGRNSAMPHAQPSYRPIEENEPVVVDIGARVEGYVSDLTRTLCLGEPDEKFKQIYAIVLQAQLQAEKNIHAGMTGGEADRLARSIIEKAGYKDNFGHSLGHGLGIVAHESPRLGTNSKDILKNNMVFTIEPGIYLPDWGGVRIEDTVLMKNDKIKVLSQAEK
jgi:Xaa-Pro aminopeptidase